MSEDAEIYDAIEHSRPEMGMNYLIADGTVYGVMMWALGGVAYRKKWTPDDPEYETRYITAANNPHTLFKKRTR